MSSTGQQFCDEKLFSADSTLIRIDRVICSTTGGSNGNEFMDSPDDIMITIWSVVLGNRITNLPTDKNQQGNLVHNCSDQQIHHEEIDHTSNNIEFSLVRFHSPLFVFCNRVYEILFSRKNPPSLKSAGKLEHITQFFG